MNKKHGILIKLHFTTCRTTWTSLIFNLDSTVFPPSFFLPQHANSLFPLLSRQVGKAGEAFHVVVLHSFMWEEIAQSLKLDPTSLCLTKLNSSEKEMTTAVLVGCSAYWWCTPPYKALQCTCLLLLCNSFFWRQWILSF